MSEPRYPAPIATVDAVLMTLSQGALCVGLLRRDRAPFAGSSRLPGGYVHVPEDRSLEASAARILRDKARLECRFLEQLGTFSGARARPAGLVADRGLLRAGAGGRPVAPLAGR